jgi:kinesin family protein 5
MNIKEVAVQSFHNLTGIIPRMILDTFSEIENSDSATEWKIKISIIEIYMEKIRDLLDLAKKNLKIREKLGRAVFIQDVSEFYVLNVEEVMSLMRIANKNRVVSHTNMNDMSSRSHLIFTMEVHQQNTEDGSVRTRILTNLTPQGKSGKLIMVDLAGSEKVGKTGAKGTTLDEAKNINKSLSALGNVINSLTDGKSAHIPYRSSTLTRLL